MKKLLDRLGLTRADVRALPGADADAARNSRAALLAEAMRPSGTTGRWHEYARSADRAGVRAALANVSLIEAPSAQDEAEAVALILREAAETPGRTAALVSPDRLLARRVAMRLEAWGIRVDDSAGRPFAKTVPGAFLDLVIDAVSKDFAPAATMALLKHPLTRLGLDAFPVRRAARALEIAAFRDVYLGRGLDGIAAALVHAEQAVAAGERRQTVVRRLRPDDWKEAHDLVARLKQAFAPLSALFAAGGEHPLQDLAAAHVAAAEALARLPADGGEEGSPLWREEAGTAAAAFFAGIVDPKLAAPKLRAADYADLYRSLIAGENVRPRVAVHPRLFIWGPFEARLQQTDVMVLGSLNDGTWPEAADPGPWLNRPMRAELGPAVAGGEDRPLRPRLHVVPRRAPRLPHARPEDRRRADRALALADAAAGAACGLELGDALRPADPWLGWARARDRAGERIRIAAPEPRPPLDLRPRKMSVTRVETWLSNPYAIFARDILKLDKLPALGADPNAALRGTIVHAIMRRFAQAHPDALPADAERELMAIARDVIAGYDSHRARRRVLAAALCPLRRLVRRDRAGAPQRRGAHHRRGAGPAHTRCTGRAVHADGARRPHRCLPAVNSSSPTTRPGRRRTTHASIDGLAPQLPLEAAIALGEAGFAEVPQRTVSGLRYIRAAGGEPPGEERVVACGDVAALAKQALDSLAGLVARFDDAATPYKALRRVRFDYDYDDYAHLARVGEWAAIGEPEDPVP